MICPFCAIEMHPVPQTRLHSPNRMWYDDASGVQHKVESVECPRCSGVILTHTDIVNTASNGPMPVMTEANEYILVPRTSSRRPLPIEVPEPYSGLYGEAALILSDSPRASAALSRRCLQQLIRDVAGAPGSDLYNEIEWALANAGLPGYCTESLHDLRRIGNMAAHPNKSTASGDYVEVEDGEAEWTLDTLDALFGFYFIEPAKTAARKAALSAKTGL